ncbi:hypothetical protein [Legionella oakridgensis]|uniref:Transmembrane protein n=2 Tax=Legionella oakridgensis TaxID=29423 RepID=W0BH49_9GAMM|nr:hypothetical protein [Legionella oakridgensis]AHE67957.1 hypothetical protein Loa_02415 [Legionella oakridgensis ATCC 33761 = DSM 21215]ETO92588.1 hypothetical protein LOR_63c16740 [Legionella oakridgensis RV-2-2007]KTD38773.1 hypothetical protein Loak_1261 [Legionella oakridgensis]STY20957.1 Uncharacterised protein [Legionella longbeachae]
MKIIWRQYFIPISLVLLFAAPGFFAYVFYQHPQWLGATKTNKGKWLKPPILISRSETAAKWRMLLWNPQGCEKQCMQQLNKLARIRLALGRHLYEVESGLLISIDAPSLSAELADILRDQDIHVLKLTAGDLKVLSILPRVPQIYLESPDGFLVLAYSTEAKPEDIFHDVKRLLNTKE